MCRSLNLAPKTSSRNLSTLSLACASSKFKYCRTGHTRPSRAWLVGVPFFSPCSVCAHVVCFGVRIVCRGQGEGVVFAKSKERRWSAVKTESHKMLVTCWAPIHVGVEAGCDDIVIMDTIKPYKINSTSMAGTGTFLGRLCLCPCHLEVCVSPL
jgi:hypothetical protein